MENLNQKREENLKNVKKNSHDEYVKPKLTVVKLDNISNVTAHTSIQHVQGSCNCVGF